jgi:hypothetical protein
MNIETEHKNGRFFIRFTSDLITPCDIESIYPALQLALANGTRNIILSVIVGSHSNQRSITRLLRQCQAITQRKNGKLCCVALCHDDKIIYRSLCDTLHIPYFYSEREIPAGFFVPVKS